MNYRLKTALLAAIPVILIAIALMMMKNRNQVEPLSKKEILNKQTWTPDQLAYSLGRTFKPQSGDGDRRQILEHLQKQMQKFPAAEQQKIKIQAIRQAIDDTLTQYRAMKQESRQKLLDAIRKKADKNSENVRKMNQEQRSRLRDQLNSQDGQSMTREVNEAAFNRMTPEERRDFTPIQETWLRTLRSL